MSKKVNTKFLYGENECEAMALYRGIIHLCTSKWPTMIYTTCSSPLICCANDASTYLFVEVKEWVKGNPFTGEIMVEVN